VTKLVHSLEDFFEVDHPFGNISRITPLDREVDLTHVRGCHRIDELVTERGKTVVVELLIVCAVQSTGKIREVQGSA
jgi:hypothetical protein